MVPNKKRNIYIVVECGHIENADSIQTFLDIENHIKAISSIAKLIYVCVNIGMGHIIWAEHKWSETIPHTTWLVVRTSTDCVCLCVCQAILYATICYIISMVTTFRPTTQYVTFQPTIKRSYSIYTPRICCGTGWVCAFVLCIYGQRMFKVDYLCSLWTTKCLWVIKKDVKIYIWTSYWVLYVQVICWRCYCCMRTADLHR